MTLYYADIREFDELPGLALLPEKRRERAGRYLRREDQARCLVAGLLLRRFAGDERLFRYSEHGKPFLPGGPGFNLSHSGAYVILAVARQEVGADVEQARPWSEKVAARCYLPSELDWMRAQKNSLEAFYALWTAKEAVMKASGAGFSMPPETFAVDPGTSRSRDALGRAWELAWVDLPGHKACAATREPEHLSLVRATRKELL